MGASQDSQSVRRSFVEVPAGSHFPIENLPFGVFRPPGGGGPRIGVAIGDRVLDLAVLEEAHLLETPALRGRALFRRPALNAFMAGGRAAWREARARIGALLAADEGTLRDAGALREAALHRRSGVEMLLPAEIGDYTDFYSSREHATNVGTMFRGKDNALQPNWLHLPVGYHGRASSLLPSRRRRPPPAGPDAARRRRAAAARAVATARLRARDGVLRRSRQPARRADPGRRRRRARLRHGAGQRLERSRHPEVGVRPARPVPRQELRHLDVAVGRDARRPGAVPLRRADAGTRAAPLPAHHRDRGRSTSTRGVPAEHARWPRPQTHRARATPDTLYWNVAQQLAHHTVNGCNLRPGDLLASGTISRRDARSRAAACSS